MATVLSEEFGWWEPLRPESLLLAGLPLSLFEAGEGSFLLGSLLSASVGVCGL